MERFILDVAAVLDPSLIVLIYVVFSFKIPRMFKLQFSSILQNNLKSEKFVNPLMPDLY